MWFDSSVFGETGILLKFGYVLNKLEDGARKYYCSKKRCQCVFFDTTEIEIEERKRIFFLDNLIQNRAFLDYGNVRPNLLGATRSKGG